MLDDPSGRLATPEGFSDGLTYGILRTEHTADSAWDSAAALDPVDRELTVYGGTSSCEECDLLHADGDPRAESEHAWNVPGVRLVTASGVSPFSFPVSEPWHADGFFDPTVGVRSAAGAWVGFTFEPFRREWSAVGDPKLLLVGGTFQQDVSPAIFHDVLTGDVMHAFEMIPNAPEGDYRVHGLRRLEDGEVTSLAAPTIPEGLARAVASDATTLLVAGGASAGVASDLLEIVAADGTPVWSGDLPARAVGASAATDPVSGERFVLSANAPDEPLARGPVGTYLTSVQACAVPAQAARVLIAQAQTRIATVDPAAADPTGPSWEVEYGAEFTLQCPDDAELGCRERFLQFQVAADLHLDAAVIGNASYEEWPGRIFDGEIDPVTGFRQVVVGSGLELFGGSRNPSGAYTVRLRGSIDPIAEVSSVVRNYAHPRWAPYGALGPCGAEQALQWDGLPIALMADSATLADPRAQQIEVIPPDGHVVAAPWYQAWCDESSTPSTCTCADQDLLFWERSDPRACMARVRLGGEGVPDPQRRFAFTVRPDTRPPVFVDGDRFDAYVWTDECVDQRVQGAIDQYVGGAPDQSSLRGSLAWLETRLGSDAAAGQEGPLGLWIGRRAEDVPDEGTVGGLTRGGLVLVTPFDPSGATSHRAAELLRDLDGTATHELAHVYLSRRDWSGDSEWFGEAAPTLLGMMRAPGHKPLALRSGHAVRTAARFNSLEPRVAPLVTLSSVSRLDKIRGLRSYYAGPYVLAQALALGGQGLDTVAAWHALRDGVITSAVHGASVSGAELAAWLDALEPGFAAARIEGGIVGEPLLALRVTSHPATGPVTVEVRQEQVRMLTDAGVPFDLHDRVPWALGCGQQLADGTAIGRTLPVPFAECDTGGLRVDDLRVLEAEAESLTLTPVPGRRSHAAWFALFAGPTLLPEQVGLYDVRFDREAAVDWILDLGSVAETAPTWWLHCAAGSSAPACSAADSDGDGSPREADCDPLRTDVHPDAIDPAFGDLWDPAPPATDFDCDGWPGDWLFANPVEVTP